jgi:hypothetical protein
MRKIQLLRDLNAGTLSEKKAGWCVECSDETAARLVEYGDAKYMPADAPLKKGNLQFYNNCTPLSPEKIAALNLKKADAPTG